MQVGSFPRQGRSCGDRHRFRAPFIRILSIINKFSDPFYGINEQKIQWVENEDWEYRTAFTVTPEQLKRDDAQLVFEGLDTYADVYLNGALLLKADNMFVGYTIPVKSQLRIGENLLHIYFHSPIRQTMPQYNSNGFNYPADNDHHEKHCKHILP